MFKNWKGTVMFFCIILMMINLIASFWVSGGYHVVMREQTLGDNYWIVTYQEKNIWGMDIGEEFRVIEFGQTWVE